MSRRTLDKSNVSNTAVSVGALMWEEILRDYDERHAHNEERQIAWFRRQPSLRVAIETAARAADERGKRYDHQNRIRRVAIAQATAALLASELIDCNCCVIRRSIELGFHSPSRRRRHRRVVLL